MTEQGFKTAYAMLASEFKGELTDMQAETHRQMLVDDGITDEELLAGVKAIIRSRKFTNFPRYAELLEAIKGNPDDVALIALKELEDAMSIYGAYRSVIFKDKVIMACVKGMGGWQAICQMPSDEWKFQKQEFLKLYRAYHRNGKYPEVDYLVGKSEHQNRIDGYATDADSTKVQLIGYSEQYPKELPALTVKTLVSKQVEAIESKRDIKNLTKIKRIGEVK